MCPDCCPVHGSIVADFYMCATQSVSVCSRHTHGVMVSGPVLLGGRLMEYELSLGKIDELTDSNIR